MYIMKTSVTAQVVNNGMFVSLTVFSIIETNYEWTLD